MSTLVHVHGGVGVLRHPIGIAVDAVSNRIIVGDSGHHCIRGIDKITGVVTKIAGSVDEEGLVDGPSDLARFFHPCVVFVVCTVGTLRYCACDSIPGPQLVSLSPQQCAFVSSLHCSGH